VPTVTTTEPGTNRYSVMQPDTWRSLPAGVDTMLQFSIQRPTGPMTCGNSGGGG
jgi:hypothetical protein